jgi:hypothetical protein
MHGVLIRKSEKRPLRRTGEDKRTGMMFLFHLLMQCYSYFVDKILNAVFL